VLGGVFLSVVRTGSQRLNGSSPPHPRRKQGFQSQHYWRVGGFAALASGEDVDLGRSLPCRARVVFQVTGRVANGEVVQRQCADVDGRRDGCQAEFLFTIVLLVHHRFPFG
jgi:hypothetical protein